MVVNYRIYDKKFFKNTLKLEKFSAFALVQILINFFAPHSVIDIGCGNGIYLKEFKKRGVKIKGFDGSPSAVSESLVGKKIILHDLCKPLRLNQKFDLCLCFEVAEHLPGKCADTLIGSLTNLSDIIIFTAATPGQGPKSIGHINEQPHKYWMKKFKNRNYIFSKELTKKIKFEMKEKNVIWWITKNIMIFNKLYGKTN